MEKMAAAAVAVERKKRKGKYLCLWIMGWLLGSQELFGYCCISYSRVYFLGHSSGIPEGASVSCWAKMISCFFFNIINIFSFPLFFFLFFFFFFFFFFFKCEEGIRVGVFLFPDFIFYLFLLFF